MLEHSFDVTWVYVVPPHNDVRVRIMQRQDGPYRWDDVGGLGSYYISVEELVRGEWRHVQGSVSAGKYTFPEAQAIAQKAWDREFKAMSERPVPYR